MRAALCPLALLTVLLPLPLAAQERFALELRAGGAVPAGELAKVNSSGLTLGGGVAVRLRGPLRARIDLEATFLGEGDSEFGTQSPGVNFVHRTAGLELLIGRPERSGPRVSANFGAGLSTFEIEGYVARTGPDEGRTFASSERYPVVTGGLAAEVGSGRLVAFVVRAQGYAVLTDEGYTAQFQRISTRIEPFSRAWTFPITAGLRIRW